ARLMRRRIARSLSDAPAERMNAQLLAELEGALGAEEVMNGSRIRGAHYLVRAAVFDRKFRQRLKWLLCAVVVPFTDGVHFEKLYSSSVSRAFMGHFREQKIN